MSDRTTARKAVILVLPLVVSVLGLHAWGQGLADGLGRAVAGWQYPEHRHLPYLIRVPRSSDADVFVARALGDFVSAAVRSFGAELGLRAPTLPVQVVLLDPDTDSRRFGGSGTDPARGGDEVYDPERRLIVVRTERKLQQEPVTAALQRAAARLLLHDAGYSRASPWLFEGLAGCLEGLKEADLRAWTGELPGLGELLRAPEPAFASRSKPSYGRAAHLFAAWLLEKKRDPFALYRKAEAAGTTEPLRDFERLVGDPARLEAQWKAWMNAPGR